MPELARAHSREPSPTAGDGINGSIATEISNAVVRAYAEYLGRGPTKARTVLGADLVSVVLEDTLTKAERKLVESGEEALVVDTRRVVQATMRDDLVAAVEKLTGRKVVAFLSDQQADPDFAIESFVLEPRAAGAENGRRA
jgi:uncharacterized protein YbcI